MMVKQLVFGWINKGNQPILPIIEWTLSTLWLGILTKSAVDEAKYRSTRDIIDCYQSVAVSENKTQCQGI